MKRNIRSLKSGVKKKVENISEKFMLEYFSMKSEKKKSSSLWIHYSMLRCTVSLKKNVDINQTGNRTQDLSTLRADRSFQLSYAGHNPRCQPNSPHYIIMAYYLHFRHILIEDSERKIVKKESRSAINYDDALDMYAEDFDEKEKVRLEKKKEGVSSAGTGEENGNRVDDTSRSAHKESEGLYDYQ
ncbi:uncharacterized protein [Periplaneta americana]|uniref:uncharacterized protein isoform X4 n=1 Tax=Periplaneta americana TaxID=6978 RepID=UPI0037E87E88